MVDFDKQPEWVKYFQAPRQSTLYLYDNNKQLWRSVAETRQKNIFEALEQVEGRQKIAAE